MSKSFDLDLFVMHLGHMLLGESFKKLFEQDSSSIPPSNNKPRREFWQSPLLIATENNIPHSLIKDEVVFLNATFDIDPSYPRVTVRFGGIAVWTTTPSSEHHCGLHLRAESLTEQDVRDFFTLAGNDDIDSVPVATLADLMGGALLRAGQHGEDKRSCKVKIDDNAGGRITVEVHDGHGFWIPLVLQQESSDNSLQIISAEALTTYINMAGQMTQLRSTTDTPKLDNATSKQLETILATWKHACRTVKHQQEKATSVSSPSKAPALPYGYESIHRAPRGRGAVRKRPRP